MAMALEDLPNTVGGVREAHLRLIREWRSTDRDVAVQQALRLREVARDAGVGIANPADRDEVQGIIDYWASAISGVPGQRFPNLLQVAPYSGEKVAQAVASAESIYAALSTEEDRRVARAIFEDLVARRDGDVVRATTTSRATLQQRIGGTRVDAVLELFERPGVLSRIGADGPADDRFEITDISLVERWPDLMQWLVTRDEKSQRRDRLLRRAERWDGAGRPSLDLANWSELKTIDRFLDQTDVLNDYIKASKRRRIHIIASAATAAALLVAFVGFNVWTFSENQGTERTLETAKVALTAKEAIFENQVAPVDLAEKANANAVDTDAVEIADSGTTEQSFPALRGGIWLGSDTLAQVRAVDARSTFVPPGSAEIGTRYRVRVPFYLRDDWPKSAESYQSLAVKAVIPAASIITLLSKPRLYRRPSGVQYWARVQVTPRVYIQYATVGREQIDRLRRSLAAAGWEVPAAERLDSARGLAEVRYFNSPGRELARSLIQTLGPALADTPAVRNQVSCVSPSQNSTAQVEIWIDPTSREPAERPVRAC